MGVTRHGRFAAITNYRDPARTAPAPRSRGELPLEFLRGDGGPRPYLEQLSTRAHEYAGFNLLLGDGADLWYYSNSDRTSAELPRHLEPGIYGLSNAQLDTPWPKVLVGKRKMQALLDSRATPDHDSLASVVGDRATADPRALLQQGLDGEMDQLLSAQFIVTSRYGTRSTTTLWRERDGATRWREMSFDEKGVLVGTQAADMAGEA
jgi:uncharacterized protein with NRDE domain